MWVCVRKFLLHTHIAPTSYASLLQPNSFSFFFTSLRLVLVSPGFPPSKVSVELDPGFFFSLSTVGDGFCYRCQLLPRSFSVCFFKNCWDGGRRCWVTEVELKEKAGIASSKNTCGDQEMNLQGRLWVIPYHRCKHIYHFLFSIDCPAIIFIYFFISLKTQQRNLFFLCSHFTALL